MRAIRLSKSLILSLCLHAMFFAALLTTMSFDVKQPPIIINLAKNPGNDKTIVQAALIDKRAVDLANQRRAVEERLQQEKILEQQRIVEQAKQEAEHAKQALELAAALKAQQQAMLEQVKQEKAKKAQENTKQIQEQAKKIQEQEKLDQQLLVKQQIAQQQQLAKQQAAAKQQKAAALKAERDRLVAENQAMLEGEVELYRAKFAAAIEENRVLSAVFAKDIRCKLKIMLLPDGSILNIKVLESSGNIAYDEMSAKAVYKSAPFPMPQDQELYKQLREVILSFKNGEQ
jgi:colicin import membrane protein